MSVFVEVTRILDKSFVYLVLLCDLTKCIAHIWWIKLYGFVWNKKTLFNSPSWIILLHPIISYRVPLCSIIFHNLPRYHSLPERAKENDCIGHETQSSFRRIGKQFVNFDNICSKPKQYVNMMSSIQIKINIIYVINFTEMAVAIRAMSRLSGPRWLV